MPTASSLEVEFKGDNCSATAGLAQMQVSARMALRAPDSRLFSPPACLPANWQWFRRSAVVAEGGRRGFSDPRRVSHESCGPRIAPKAFCTCRTRWPSSAPFTTARPAMRSLCPPMNLVALCTTMSKPSSSGRCNTGDMKVLSVIARSRVIGRSRRPRRDR